MKKIIVLLLIAFMLNGCGAIRISNKMHQTDITFLSVLKAEVRDDGRYTCSNGANTLNNPIAPGKSHLVWPLWPGRYCVKATNLSTTQVDVPLIGIVTINID